MALVGSLLLYAASWGWALAWSGETLFGSTLIVTAGWLILAIFQVRWWSAGKAKFWRPPFGWWGIVLLCASLIGLPTLLIARWRRWLLRNLKPEDDPVEDVLRMLSELRATGVLTDAEYDAKREGVISGSIR